MRSAASGWPPACTGCGCHPGPHADTWRVSPLPAEQQLDTPQKERLGAALAEMDQQLRKLADTPWLCQPMEPSDEEVCGHFRLDAPGSPFRACVQCTPRSFAGGWRGGASVLQPLIWLLKTCLFRRLRVWGGVGAGIENDLTTGTCRSWKQSCGLTRK